MYPEWVVPLGLGMLSLWAGIISFLVWRQSGFLGSLFPKSGERDIRKKFEEVVKAVEGFKQELISYEDKLESVKIEGLGHVQRVALMRFNPYGDTGGDISFTACFLDKEGSGVIITSMHARSGTRVFGKEVTKGKSRAKDLSKEEELIIRKAMEK